LNTPNPLPLGTTLLCGPHIFVLIVYISSELIMTLREEHSLRVFKSGVLKKIFGIKRDEVTGEWKRLQTEELYDLYSTNIKRRRKRWEKHVVSMGEETCMYGFGGKT
jgi:hypothetical protein